MINTLIEELEHIIRNINNDGFVLKFEQKLKEIYLTNNTDIICKLLKVMDDKFEYDELMFSIIHTIESFDNKIYVTEVIKSFPDFIFKSPRWASIIVMRIINSQNCRNEFMTRLQNLSVEKKESIRLLLSSMGKRGYEIEEKVKPLMRIIS